MARKFMGGFVGLIAGMFLILVVQAIGHRIWPFPEGMDAQDRAQLEAYIADAPTGALLWVAVSYAAGSFGGAFVASRIGRAAGPAWAVGALLLLAGVVNVFTIAHPTGIAAVYLATFLPMAWLGGRMGAPSGSVE